VELSIVTTLYHSAPYLEEFYRRISETARKITDDYEIILVNDGSPDNSAEIAISLFEKDEKVTVIDLSRNFNHHKAVMTGLEHTKGFLVFSIACDLEEKPELLSKFYAEIKKKPDTDVIYGVQEKRKGQIFERISGGLFYSLFNMLSSDPIPRNLISARLMTRRYVQSLVRHREREVFMGGLMTITGYNQVPIVVRKGSKGSSTYTLRRRVSLLVNAITSFSNKPLVYIFYLGCIISLIAAVSGFALILRKLLFGKLIIGWASVMVSAWFLGGITIFCLGILGIYFSKIFSETKRRPYTIIRQVYGEKQRSSFPEVREGPSE
jgi:putative glycosyltransferase